MGPKFGTKQFRKVFEIDFQQSFGQLKGKIGDKFLGTDNLGTFGCINNKKRILIF